MKNKYFKVNRRYTFLALGFIFLTVSSLSLYSHNIRAESLSDPNPVVSILGGLLKLVIRPEVRPGTTLTPTPIIPSCTDPNNLYPYAKFEFGLDYHIPFRDPTVRPGIDLRQALQGNRIPRVGGQNAKIEYIDTIMSMSTSRGWNPAFILSLWLEETEGSHSTVKPYGDAPGIPGSNCGVSHTGYGPCYGGVRPIDVELGWIFNARDKYKNEKFAHFMAGWSGGGCVDTDGDGRPDGGADAYFNNICTMNPFINNPNFTKNLKAVYSYLVPPGTHGALTEASQAGNTVCPTATPTPPSTGNYTPIVVDGLTYYPQCSSTAIPGAYWSSHILPGCSSYCSVGCGISSSAMIFSSLSGETRDPEQFMTLYAQYQRRMAPGAEPSCRISYYWLSGMFREHNITSQSPIVFQEPRSLFSSTGSYLVDGYLESGQTLLVFGTVSGYTHFVWIVGKENGDYTIMDPYWGAPPLGGNPPFPVIPYKSSRYSSFMITSLLPVKRSI